MCPIGWHLPTDDEWKGLEIELRMTQNDVNRTGWRGTNQGYLLKTKTGWNSNGNGINKSGFDALPSGNRGIIGEFTGIGEIANWWSATPFSKAHAIAVRLTHNCLLFNI